MDAETATSDHRLKCERVFGAFAAEAVTWLLMTSPRPHPQRSGASSRLSSLPLAPPT